MPSLNAASFQGGEVNYESELTWAILLRDQAYRTQLSSQARDQLTGCHFLFNITVYHLWTDAILDPFCHRLWDLLKPIQKPSPIPFLRKVARRWSGIERRNGPHLLSGKKPSLRMEGERIGEELTASRASSREMY